MMQRSCCTIVYLRTCARADLGSKFNTSFGRALNIHVEVSSSKKIISKSSSSGRKASLDIPLKFEKFSLRAHVTCGLVRERDSRPTSWTFSFESILFSEAELGAV